MLIHDNTGIGRIDVTTLALPDFVREPSGTFTYSGRVLVDYKTDKDPDEKDHINLAVLDANGEGFRCIFSGVVPQSPTANGIRYMPFADNRRVLLGDYVLECTPDIDGCTGCVLVPVDYPWGMREDARVFKHWSEVVIAPDNEHVAWTALLGEGGAVLVGRLQKEGERYVIENPQIINSGDALVPDPDRPGFLLPQEVRGGEVKQFVRGGMALSLVGAKDSAITDSVVQDLLTGDVTNITQTAGYDETTIFSPDERLGVVMSPRGSAGTNCAIFGLMPRPHAHLVTGALSLPAYLFSVADVRNFREGNIGPVLIDIEKSIQTRGYPGIQLNEPDSDWVYCSPISWHPSGNMAMWREVLRGSFTSAGGPQFRSRIARLLDYVPGPYVSPQRTPEEIPYGSKEADMLWRKPAECLQGKIAGKHSGYIAYEKQVDKTCSRYVQFSDDGQVFYDGYEKIERTRDGG